MEVGGWLRGGGGGEAPRARLCWVEPDGERGFHGRVASRKEEKRERQTLSLSLSISPGSFFHRKHRGAPVVRR